MVRKNGNGNSNGNGHIPPEGPPPENPGGDVPEQPDGDNDQNRQTIEFIGRVVDSRMEQYMALFEERFEAINKQQGEIAQKLEQIVPVLNEHTQILQQAQSSGAPAPQTAATETAGPANASGGLDLKTALAYALTHLGEVGQGLASVAQGYTQFKAANRPPDPVGVAEWLKATHPNLLNAYVPDSMGGRFHSYQEHAYKAGMDTAIATLRPILQKAGINLSPLGEPSSGGNDWSTTPAEHSTEPTPSVGLSSLNDTELDLALDQLMRVKLERAHA